MEKITYKKSFASKLILEQNAIPYYQDIKDLCATRKKVSTRLSFGKETINFGKNKVAVMKISRKNITLYLSLTASELEGTKYNVKDTSETKDGYDYPVSIQIKGSRTLKHALELLEMALNKVGATEIVEAEHVDYSEVFKYRDFDTLVKEGLIKKYIKVVIDGVEQLVEVPAETYNVTLTAKLVFDATNAASDLYVITSHTGWDFNQAVKMDKQDENTFTATLALPKDTALEFKVCKSKNWTDVEKGIWKEEIVNHNYNVVDKDLEVEDLIHNFRKD